MNECKLRSEDFQRLSPWDLQYWGNGKIKTQLKESRKEWSGIGRPQGSVVSETSQEENMLERRESSTVD